MCFEGEGSWDGDGELLCKCIINVQTRLSRLKIMQQKECKTFVTLAGEAERDSGRE